MFFQRYLLAYALLAAATYFCCYDVQAKAEVRRLYYRSVNYSYNAKYVESFQINRMQQDEAMTVNLSVARKVPENFWVELVAFIKPAAVERFQKVLHFNLDACSLLKHRTGPSGYNILKQWANNLLRTGNKSISCPLLKGNYSWIVQPTDKHRVHILRVAGFYRFMINLYIKKSNGIEKLLNTTTNLEIFYK